MTPGSLYSKGILPVLLALALAAITAGSAWAFLPGPVKAALDNNLGPKVAELIRTNQTIDDLLKETKDERQFNILREMLYNSQSAALIGQYEIRILKLGPRIAPAETPAYYQETMAGLKKAAAQVREHGRKVELFRAKLKSSPALANVDKAKFLLDETANHLDVIALMLERERTNPSIGEQTIK
jgi:hypothetical protein